MLRGAERGEQAVSQGCGRACLVLQERSCEDFYCGLFVSYRQARTHSQLSARLWEVSGGGGEEGSVWGGSGEQGGCAGRAGGQQGHRAAAGPAATEKTAPAISRDLLATQRGLP